MDYSRKYIFFIGLLIVSISCSAQHSSPDSLHALFYKGDIVLDGKLDEACWKNAIPIDNFTQREQNTGESATERTKISVVYTTNKIYFGFWCYDSEPDKLSAQKMARDFNWGSDDNIEIMVSPFNDNRNGYLFVTNPNGALADVLIGDEGREWNKSWNAVWDVAVDVNDSGWFVEMVIPFTTLKFKKDSVQNWGINFERNIRRKNEQLLWQGWSRIYEVETISQGGTLTGIENIKQGTKIELKPYLLSGVEWNGGKPPTTVKVGGEVNLDITPSLKLNFSVNTDFAQVESDRLQINLSRFSLFYPEKRQFFLEGKTNYEMNVGDARMFYSRRIGIEDGEVVPIIGGVRLYGKVKKTNIGVMSIQTYAKDSIPTTNYAVVNVKQDVFKRSSVGVMMTQKISEKGTNGVYGTNFTYNTANFLDKKNLLVGGSMAVSQTTVFDQQNVDLGNHLAYDVFLSYPNDIVEFDMGFSTVQGGFNPEMGFTRRSNYQMFYTELQFNPRFKKLPFFRNLIFKPIDINYFINDETKEVASVFYEWRPFGFVTKSGEFFEFNIQHVYDNPTQDFELIDSVIIPAGSYWNNKMEIQFRTFRGRKISAGGSLNSGEFYTGHRQEYSVFTNLNLNKHLNLSIDYQKNIINLPEGDLNTDEWGGRVEYAFNPKLQTSIFGQWNNEVDRVIVNYRVNWIPVIGSFFYFVVNQEISTNNKIKIERTTVMAKLIWRFAL